MTTHAPPSERRAGTAVMAAFAFSGASSLTYQVLWVRELGLVFGNTVTSAALVTSLFMFGLGLGSFVAGRWSDRAGRRARDLLWAYVALEVAIAIAGLAVGVAAPHLTEWLASLSSYAADGRGWHHISAGTFGVRAAVGAALYGPICVAMGATLPILVRALSWRAPERASLAVAWLYASNTFGAALGAFLVDQWWIPTVGTGGTTLVAVGLGVLAALLVASQLRGAPEAAAPPRAASASVDDGQATQTWLPSHRAVMGAMFFSGLCALGYEIVWFRVLRYALGGTRGVFSVVLSVVLIGLFLGALLAARVPRKRAADALVAALIVGGAGTVGLVAIFDVDALKASGLGSGVVLTALLCLLPSTAFGATLPLASAVALDDPKRLGRGIGGLYAAQTAGNICGALAAGFVFIPAVGTWLTAVNLGFVGGLGAALLVWSSRACSKDASWRRAAAMVAGGGAVIAILGSADGDAKLSAWLDAGAMGSVKVLVVDEGPSDLVMVTEGKTGRRHLYTNGHPMSGTSTLAERYMRGMAHVPLLLHPAPERALVICFGVGNTADAVRQHPTLQRLDIADLSEEVLELAPYFRRTHHDVLDDERVHVFVNDGRHHLWLQPEGTYDLVTLEPPPVTFAGMASLYSREFYALARSRLSEGGFVTQWLPAYQTAPDVTLAMVRAFIDTFDNALLLLGFHQELILIGSKRDAPITFDPERLRAAIARDPALARSLRAVYLDDVHELVSMIVSGPRQLTLATHTQRPVSDGWPLNEYPGALGRAALPPSLFDVSAARRHCPRCPPPASPAGQRLDEVIALTEVLVQHPSFLLERQAPPLELGIQPPEGGDAERLSQEPFLLTQFASVEGLRLRAQRVKDTDLREAIALLTKASRLTRHGKDRALAAAVDEELKALRQQWGAPPGD